MSNLLLSYLTGGLAVGLLSILSTFLLTRILSPDVFGLAMLFFSLVQFLFCCINLGMDQVFVRFFYEPQYKNNTALLIYRCMLIVLFGFIFVSVVLFSLQDKIAEFLQMDFFVIPMLLLSSVLFCVMRFLQLMPRLMEKPKDYNLAKGLNEFFILFNFLIIFYVVRASYWSYIFAQALAMFFVITWLAYRYREKLRWHQASMKWLFDATELKAFLKYGYPSLFSLSLTWAFANIDKYFILKWSSSDALGIYTAAFALVAPMQLIQSTFTTAWVPRMTQMLIKSPYKSKRDFSMVFEKLSFTLTVIFLWLVLIKKILILFLGPKFHNAADVFPWLLFSPFFWALSEVVYAGIIKSKKTYWHIVISLISLSVNLVGCWILIPILAAKGAAIALAMSFAGFFLARYFFAFRYYPFKVNALKLFIQIGIIVFSILCNFRAGASIALFISALLILSFMERRWLFNMLQSMNPILRIVNSS